MSDFLSRIAARAVGEAPLAQPRLPALFEQPGGGEAFGPAIVDEQVIVPSPARQIQTVEPMPAAGDAAPGKTQGPLATPDVAEPERPVAMPAAAASTPQIADPPEPSDTLSLGETEALGTPPATVPVAASEQPLPAVPAAVAATPAGVDARFPEPPAPAAVPAEQPAVRVHIGRLEVRANLQDAAPPARPRAAEFRPEGLSLSDYLRGKRGAG